VGLDIETISSGNSGVFIGSLPVEAGWTNNNALPAQSPVRKQQYYEDTPCINFHYNDYHLCMF
jgi:hypothetical protein